MAQKKFQELDLKDAFLFAAAMEDEEICCLTLQILLNRSVDSVTVRVEHPILYSSNYRSIRLDVYAQDAAGRDYNVEMQGENRGNLPKRSRFHQAKMDVASIPPGADFNDLKPSYVIFICSFDPFGKGLYQYTFENRCLERDFPLEDGTVKIFLSTKGTNDEETAPELIHYLRYVENSTDRCAEMLQDQNVNRLHDKVTALKKSREWEDQYMMFTELLEDAKKEGLQQGLNQGQERMLLLIRRMLENGEVDQLPRLSEDESFLQEMYLKYQL